MRQVIQRNPKCLKVHPLNLAIPRLKEGMPEWLAMYDDIEERGIQVPIEICGNLVIDGETRRGIAAKIGLKSVPCVVVPPNEVVTKLREHLIAQKHLTKGQRAYLLIPHIGALVEESKARSLANLRRGNSPTPIESASGNIGNFEDFCRANGFSGDVGIQARTLHQIWAGDPATLRSRNIAGVDLVELRETWEPKILDLENPVGLGAALAGIAGEVSTRDKKPVPNGDIQLELFQEGASAIDRVAKAWPKMRTADRPKIVAAWKRLTLGWPSEMRRELGTALLDGTETK